MERHRQEVEQLKAQLWEAEQQQGEAAQRRQDAQQECQEQRKLVQRWQREIQDFDAELEGALLARARAGAAAACGGGPEDDAAALDQLREAVAELAGKLRSGWTWAEAEHQKYMDFSTEVATLREMAARELRERQDASKQQVADIRGLTQRLSDLKVTAKILRDHVRRLSGVAAQQEAEPDLQRLAESVLEFRALPRETKLWALLDDAVVLRLLALAFLLGALLLLAIFIEVFGAKGCRLVCGR